MIIPELRMGGAQRSFVKVAHMLAKYHEVNVLIFNRDMPIDFKMSVPVHSLDVSGRSGFRHKSIDFVKRYRNLIKYADSFNPDVVVSYLEGANYLNALLPSRFHKVISQRGSVFHDETMNTKFRRLRLHILIRFIYGFADTIIALNENIKSELHKAVFRNKRIVVIENMFDIHSVQSESFKETPEFVRQLDRKILCCAGRLAREKGFHHIIHILKLLNSHKQHYALFILGDGPETNYLQELINSLGLKFDTNLKSPGADVYFFGKMSNPFPYIRHADSLLISSSSEGGPNVLMEAFICETLVISANCPSGPRERLAPGQNIPFSITDPVFADNGILMPVFQNAEIEQVYQVWANLIHTSLEDQENMKRLTQNAFLFAQNFTEEKIYPKWLNALGKVS